MGRRALPRRRRRRIRLPGPPRACPPSPPPDPAPCAVRRGMGGAAHRRRAGGVGGEVGFFYFFDLTNFFYRPKFYPNFFLFDFDANFFILSIFFRMQNFFCSRCQISLYKISQFLSLKFLFLTFSLKKNFSLQNFSWKKFLKSENDKKITKNGKALLSENRPYGLLPYG